MDLRLLSVVGARPNFMKIAPFIQAINDHNAGLLKETAEYGEVHIDHILVHTGQHYDANMSDSFFRTLGIPEPDINMGIGSGSHAEQVGTTMIEFEKVLRTIRPHWVIVVGDVNATLACSVTAKKEHIQCCHIEAGLRSRDLRMPEEINRLVTDRLSDLLLTPDPLSGDNLRNEGVPAEKIRFVGNIMIDTLMKNLKTASELSIKQIIINSLLDSVRDVPDFHANEFALMTLHRPSNVDDPAILGAIVDFLIEVVQPRIPLVWAVHPRTQKQLKAFDLWENLRLQEKIFVLDPLGYKEMLRLNTDARVMLTDSGGLQEECTVLGTPCLTLRFNTERPITLQEHGGVSILVGNDVQRLKKEFLNTMESERVPVQPEFWDGKTAPRCVRALLDASVPRMESATDAPE